MSSDALFLPAASEEQWIHDYIKHGTLAKHRKMEFEQHIISGAHWFRIAAYWYRLNHGYNNPLNWGCVHSELMHVFSEAKPLANVLKHRTLVFFGIGVGDTEMACVDLQLRTQRHCESILIDINEEFLRVFVKSLANRKREASNTELTYRALHGLFERVEPKHLKCANARFVTRALICLGSTIGNYSDLNEPFSIFSRLAEKGDALLLGYQLDTHLHKTFAKYKANGLYLDLIGNFLKQKQRDRIEWKLNSKTATIEAWLDGVQLFRSKKFTVPQVKQVAQRHGWRESLCSVDKHRNVCLHAFEKAD
jgi:hypothetical protein